MCLSYFLDDYQESRRKGFVSFAAISGQSLISNSFPFFIHDANGKSRTEYRNTNPIELGAG